MKRIRHKVILDLIRTGNIASQEDLLSGLRARNIKVSQSTLSRDIQELRLAKTGGVYTVVDYEPPKTAPDAARRIIREFLLDIALTPNIVVLKTGPGNASPLTQAIDDAQWPEAAGTLAGENTVFIAVRSSRDGRRLERRLREILE